MKTSSFFNFNVSLFSMMFFLFSGISSVCAYTWTGNASELNTDYTNTQFWTPAGGTETVTNFKGTVNVSWGNSVTFSKYTFNVGAANAASVINVDGTLNITANRPVTGIGNANVNVYNIKGTYYSSASNFCFGENNSTKSTMNIFSGGNVIMSGLVGSCGQTTINLQNGGALRFEKNVVLGWRGGNSTYTYMGLINQTGGTATAMSAERTWTSISGIGITSNNSGAAANCTMPSGQYILSGGTMNTLRFACNDDYDEEKYSGLASSYTNSDRAGIYTAVGLTDAQKTQANMKCFIMTGGEANIVSVSNITADDSAAFGTLEVPTLFLGGKLNALKINAGRMTGDTFEQYGGALAPDTAVWMGNALTTNRHSISSTSVTGNFRQYGGSLWFDAASGTSYDKLTVSGNAELAGTLYVTDSSGTKTGTSTFDFISAGTLTAQDSFCVVGGGVNVTDTAFTAANNKVSVTLTYGDTITYNWKGGTADANEFLTRTAWTDNNGNAHNSINYNNHIFGDSTNGNASARVASGVQAGSAVMNMAAGTSSAVLTIDDGGQYEVLGAMSLASAAGSSATLNVNGTFLAGSTLTSGAGTTKITVGNTGKMNAAGTAILMNTTLNSAGTVNFGGETRFTGTAAITDGMFTASAGTLFAGYGNGTSASLTLGTADKSTSPSVTVKRLNLAGEGSGSSVGNLTVNSGNLNITDVFDAGYAANSTATFTLNGGNVTVNGMCRFTENTNSNMAFNMTGGNLLLKGKTTWGSHGQTTVNISGDTMTALSQFVLNFYEQTDAVTQTGGTVNLWANGVDGWNVRTNPGYISGYTNSNVWHAGLQFGNTGNAATLRNMNGSTTWKVSGGEFNAYRVFNLINPTENMFYISGDAQVNIISNGAADGKYYGILSAPTSMTGGTLNVETIYTLAPYYNSSNVLTEAAHNYMLEGVFKQEGGVLSPDGGSVNSVTNAFTPSATGISSTKIIGNYALSGTGAVKLDVGAFSSDFNAENDSVKIVCADGTNGGNADISGKGVKINLSSALLADVKAGNYDADLSASRVLLMTAANFQSSVVSWYGWNDQMADTGYYWTPQIDAYGTDGLLGLYAMLASAADACYWDETLGGWSQDVYVVPEFYVGSSAIGNSSAAPSAVLNQPVSGLGTMRIAQKNGDSGKLTIKNDAQISSVQLNEVGIAGNGELVIDAGSEFTASNLALGVESTGTGTFTVNGTSVITTLSQGNGTANITVGAAGSLSVANAFTFKKGNIKSAGTLAFNAPTTVNSGTVTLEGDSKTSLIYSENSISFFGTGTNTASLEVKGNAQLQIAGGSDDNRYMKFGSGTSSVTLNAQTIVGFGDSRSLTWLEAHNSGDAAANTFFQYGGTLAPDGGTTKNMTLAVGEYGNTAYKTFSAGTVAANTTILGNYVVDLKSAADKTVPVISLDFYTLGETTAYDTITIQNGNVTLDGDSILELVFDDRSAANPADIYDVLSIQDGTLTGTFGALSIRDLATNTTELIQDAGALAAILRSGNNGISIVGLRRWYRNPPHGRFCFSECSESDFWLGKTRNEAFHARKNETAGGNADARPASVNDL